MNTRKVTLSGGVVLEYKPLSLGDLMKANTEMDIGLAMGRNIVSVTKDGEPYDPDKVDLMEAVKSMATGLA